MTAPLADRCRVPPPRRCNRRWSLVDGYAPGLIRKTPPGTRTQPRAQGDPRLSDDAEPTDLAGPLTSTTRPAGAGACRTVYIGPATSRAGALSVSSGDEEGTGPGAQEQGGQEQPAGCAVLDRGGGHHHGCQHRADGEPGLADALVRTRTAGVRQFEREPPAARLREHLAGAVYQRGEHEHAGRDRGGDRPGDRVEQARDDEQDAGLGDRPAGRGDGAGPARGTDLKQRDDKRVEYQQRRDRRRRSPGV